MLKNSLMAFFYRFIIWRIDLRGEMGAATLSIMPLRIMTFSIILNKT